MGRSSNGSSFLFFVLCLCREGVCPGNLIPNPPVWLFTVRSNIAGVAQVVAVEG